MAGQMAVVEPQIPEAFAPNKEGVWSDPRRAIPLMSASATPCSFAKTSAGRRNRA